MFKIMVQNFMPPIHMFIQNLLQILTLYLFNRQTIWTISKLEFEINLKMSNNLILNISIINISYFHRMSPTEDNFYRPLTTLRRTLPAVLTSQLWGRWLTRSPCGRTGYLTKRKQGGTLSSWRGALGCGGTLPSVVAQRPPPWCLA